MSETLSQIQPDILRRSVEHVKSIFTIEDAEKIRALHKEHGDNWWIWVSTLKLPNGSVIPRGHFDFGMRMRNSLREHVGLDDILPFNHGWEDCYVEIVEVAVGLRPNPLAQEENP